MSRYGLYAPPGYWAMTPDVKEAMDINGCGPAGWMTMLVPDTIYGLDVSIACDIHDYMYAIGQTMNDKDEADDVFRNNLTRLVMAKTKWKWLKKLRLRRVTVYYEAVHQYGGPWFWADKNPPETLGLVMA